jgi:hypothetical protein
MRGPSRSFVCSIAKERSGLRYAGLHSQRVRLPGDAFSNFCSGSYGARRFRLESETANVLRVRARKRRASNNAF